MSLSQISHERNIDYLDATKLSVPERKAGKNALLETDAAAGSTSLELQTPWPQGLRANLFPQKNFDVYIKNMVLIDPRGNKGTKYKLSEKTYLCWEAGTVSGLEQTRFQTGFNIVAGPLYCIGKIISHFTFMWSQLRWYAFNIKQCKKIKLPKEWPYSIQKLLIFNESSRLFVKFYIFSVNCLNLEV